MSSVSIAGNRLTDREVNVGALPAISPALAIYHQNRRILLVDDLIFALHQTKREIETFFPPHWNNSIDLEANPLQVVGRLEDARRNQVPYDALVLDLRMPGKNGDQLLRDIAQAGLLLPTVIHSGSHAKGLHAPLLGQLEGLRSDGVLEGVNSWQELFGVQQELVRAAAGIPVRFVPKHGPGYSPSRMNRALEAVMVIGERADWGAFNRSVSEFHPKFVDVGVSTEYCEELSEVVRIVAKATSEIRGWLAEKYPEVSESGGLDWKYFEELSVELFSNQYSTEGLAAPEEGPFRRHRLPSLVNHPGLEALHIAGLVEGDRQIVYDPQDAEKVRAFAALCRACCDFVVTRRCLEKPRTVWDLNRLAETTLVGDLAGKVKLEDASQPAPVLVRAELLCSIIEQLYRNALQAIAGKPQGAVTAAVSLLPLEAAPADIRSHFSQLAPQDRIAMLAVRDNGIGIPAELREKIFEPGFTSRIGGTGFGLYHLKKYIGELDGAYSFDSEVGQGTTFYLYFPLARDQSS